MPPGTTMFTRICRGASSEARFRVSARAAALLAAYAAYPGAPSTACTDPAIERFQPAWTARAHLLAKAGRPKSASEAYRRAIDLTTDAGVAQYLGRRLAAVEH